MFSIISRALQQLPLSLRRTATVLPWTALAMGFALLTPRVNAYIDIAGYNLMGTQDKYLRGTYQVSAISPTLVLVVIDAVGNSEPRDDLGNYSWDSVYDVYLEMNDGYSPPFYGYDAASHSVSALFKACYGQGTVLGNSDIPATRSAFFAGSPGQTISIIEEGYFFVDGVGGFESYQRKVIPYTFGQPAPVPDLPPQGLPVGQNNLQNLKVDPVNITTGAFYQNDVDLHINGPFPIELRRTYSSQSPRVGILGFGWLFGYNALLTAGSDLSTLTTTDTDGSIVAFARQGTSDVWIPDPATNPGLINLSSSASNPLNSKITRTIAGGTTTYRWELPDGSLRSYVVRTLTRGTETWSQPYLDKWIDNRGNTLSFTIGTDPAVGTFGKIARVASSSGSAVDFTYTAQGYLSQAASSDGRTVNYTINLSGDLTRVQRPDGQIFDYQYGNSAALHQITQETKPDGRIVQNVYDSHGRVIQQKSTVGTDLTPVLSATFDYTVPNQTTVYDANNHPTVYAYNADGLQTRITDPLGRVTTQTWYASNAIGGFARSLRTVTDPRGLTTAYSYDSRGNTIQTVITGDLDGVPSTLETATTTSTFNLNNLPVLSTDASGVTTSFFYTDINYISLPTSITTSKAGTILRTDNFEYTSQSTSPSLFSKGLLSRKTVAAGTTDQAVTEYTYNSAGLVVSQKALTGTTDPDVVTTFNYTPRGELQTSTDADSRSTTFTYDAGSRPTSKSVKNESGVSLATWTTTYNLSGEATQLSGFRSSPVDSAQQSYDGAGRLTQKIIARSQARADGTGVETITGATESYAYDRFGNLLTSTDALGRITSMTYDDAGQLQTRFIAGQSTESYLYEPGGNISQYTNPLGGITKKFYTAAGALRRQENPDGSVVEWRYYSDGRPQKQIMTNGAYWETTYDDVARSVTRTFKQAGGTVLATTVSEFDRRGNEIRTTDLEGFVRTTSYDDLNRVKTATGPAASAGSAQQSTTTLYGASARTLTVQNGLNESVLSIFDALGRPVQTVVKSAGGAVIRSTTFSYSADHQSVTVTQGTGAGAIAQTSYTDLAERPVLTVFGDGKFIRQAYDAKGNLLSKTDALGQTIRYAYNALDQATSETLPDGLVTAFTYNAAGGMLTRGMAGGALTHEQTYDPAGRKISERLYAGSTNTRQFTYTYFGAASPFAGLLQTVTAPRSTVTTSYDDFLRVQTVTTAGALAEVNSTTNYTYDKRGLATVVAQSSTGNAAGPATQVSRGYDGYGHLLSEVITMGGIAHSSIAQTWDAAGHRASLNESGSSLATPLFSYVHRADGMLAQVSANNQAYMFSYADNGLLAARTNPYRTQTIGTRDARGRILQQSTTVGASTAIAETMTWRGDNTLASYSATRNGAGAWNESRAYSYNPRGQLLSEGFNSSPTQANTLNYVFDNNSVGLGVRTDAKVSVSGPTWQETALAVNALARVTTDRLITPGNAFVVSGVARGADHVDVLLDGLAQGQANHPGWSDPVGAWTMNLARSVGPHTLTVKAVHPSGRFTATATSTFTIGSADLLNGNVVNTYDAEGNLSQRTWVSGLTQAFTWDSGSRLIKVVQRDGAGNGFDWSAVYDPFGRRLRTNHQPMAANVPSGASTATTSTYDPQVEFLEIGVAVNGAKAWKVYGPDLTGTLGGLQGTGGLEATLVNTGGATKGVISDQFGNGIASVTGTTVTWFATRVGGYGPLPGTSVEILTDITRVAEATAWRSRRMDPTGFINLGARHYDPSTGRFLSADPEGHGASMSLYDYAGGDPVNRFDPDGRCPEQSVNGPDGVRFVDNVIYPVGRPHSPSLEINVAAEAWQAGLHGGREYLAGVRDGVWGALTGTVHMVLHPIDSVEAVADGLGTFAGRLAFDTEGLAHDIHTGIEEIVSDPRKGGNVIGGILGGVLIGAGVDGVLGGVAKQVAAEKPFVPPEYWQKYAPEQVTPGTRRLDFVRESARTGRVEESRVIYDEFGRQKYRIDKTDHMRPESHGNPHLHEYEYHPTPQNPHVTETRHNF